MTTLIEAARQALEALEWFTAAEQGDEPPINQAITALRQAIEQAEKQEPMAWMGTDVESNPNKFRLNFDRSLIAINEKNGSPCPEFWEWLPKAYNFEGDGAFTKYNMEVAFLAGKQSVATNDTLQKRVDEIQEHRHDTSPPPRQPLTDEQIGVMYNTHLRNGGPIQRFARAIEAAHGITGEQK